jgi:hypothetical protein
MTKNNVIKLYYDILLLVLLTIGAVWAVSGLIFFAGNIAILFLCTITTLMYFFAFWLFVNNQI